MKVIFNIYDKKHLKNQESLPTGKSSRTPIATISSRTSTIQDITNKTLIAPLSFMGNIFDEINDSSFFNENNENLFSIKFFNELYENLKKYKLELSPEQSLYLTGSLKGDKLESQNNVTLVNETSAKKIKAPFIDLNGNTNVKQAEASKNFYLFDNSTSEIVKADRIFLNDNTHSQNNSGRIIWVKDSASADNVDAKIVYQRNNSTIENIVTKDFFTRDNAFSKNVNSENLILKDNANIENATSHSGIINLQDNAHINTLTVNNSKIVLGKNAKIDKIISEDNLDISGNGTVGEIKVKGSHAFLRGNIKLNGNIQFINNEGVVIVQKGLQNIFPQIDSSMVDNGILQFLIQNSKDAYLGNPVDTFSSGIKKLSESVQRRSEQNKLILNSNIQETVNSFDVETINFYSEFFRSYLQSFLSTDNNKKFSLFWINNAKIGYNNITDLWMSILGKEPEKISDTQKTYILNNLTVEEKERLIRPTTDYWKKIVLPEEINKEHFTDLYTLRNEEMIVKEIIEEIQKYPETFVHRIDNKAFLDKFLTIDLAGNNLFDYWFKEHPIPQDVLQTPRLKKQYLSTLIKNQEFVNSLATNISKALNKQTESLDKFTTACDDLLQNEPDIDKLQKKLLQKYRNSKTFYRLVATRTNYSANITEIESEIVKILTLLAQERNSLAITARKDIFDKTLNIPNVVTSKQNSQLNNFVNFVFETLEQSLPTYTPDDMDDFGWKVVSFRDYVNKKSYYFGPMWQEFVKDAYQFYNNILLDKITDNNLNLLYSIERNKTKQTNNLMNKFIEGNILNTIEQREFVSRYQNDYNFNILMANNGINHKEVLSELLLTEAINENIYQMRLNNFPQVINKDTVKINLDIVDKYLSIQDKDYPDMSINEKVNAISKIPTEEILYMNKIIFQEWKKNELQTFMSDKFRQIQLTYNINAQSKNIVETLDKINSNLDNIKIFVAGQTYTLNEIAANIDTLVDIGNNSFNELYSISKNIEAINRNTKSIRDNTRAILYSAMQNAKLRDPELSKMIEELLPETEKQSFSEFLTVVDKKYKKLKDEKKKQQIKAIIQLITVAAAASGICGISPDAISGLLGGGDLAAKLSSGLLSTAETLKHVAIIKAATTGLKQA